MTKETTTAESVTTKIEQATEKATDRIGKLFSEDSSPLMTDLLAGFTSAVAGVKRSISNSKIQEAYGKWAKSFLKIIAPMYLVAILLLILFLPLVAIFPGIALQLLSLIPFWATYLNKRLQKLGSNLFFLELSSKNPALSAELSAMASARSKVQRSWLTETTDDLKASWHFSKWSFGLAFVSIIPLLGPAVAFIGQTLLVADRLGWNLLSVYTTDCRGMRYKEEKRWMTARKFSLLGFSVPFTLLMSVPLVGPFVGGLAQAAAADLFNDVLYVKKDLTADVLDVEEEEDHLHQK